MKEGPDEETKLLQTVSMHLVTGQSCTRSREVLIGPSYLLIQTLYESVIQETVGLFFLSIDCSGKKHKGSVQKSLLLVYTG